jgi:hypothetical protein
MVGNVQGAGATAKGPNAQSAQYATHQMRAHHQAKNPEPKVAAHNTQIQTHKAQAPKGGHVNLLA